LSGGEPETRFSADYVYGLTVASGVAYFVSDHRVGDADPSGKQSSDSALYAIPLDQGQPTLVRDSFASLSSASDGTSAYFADVDTGKLLVYTPPSLTAAEINLGKASLRAITTHAGAVYAAAQDVSTPAANRGVIARVAKGGGTPTALITTAGLPNDIVVDDEAVYWTEEAPFGTFGEGHIARAALDGTNVQMLAMVDASALALDADYVYFLTDSLNRIPKRGGAIEVLAAGLEGPGLLRIVGSDALWVNLASKATSDARESTLQAMCLTPAAGT
jgi:hypothetical protein